MLFPYDTQAEMTPSAVKIQKENLKQFELTHFTELDVDRLIVNRTAFYDHLLQHLWRHFGFEELCVTPSCHVSLMLQAFLQE